MAAYIERTVMLGEVGNSAISGGRSSHLRIRSYIALLRHRFEGLRNIEDDLRSKTAVRL